MKQKKRISKTVEQYDGDWPPTDPAGFLDWFKNKLADVPEFGQDSLEIRLDSTIKHDCSYTTIEFFYTRMETDEEEAEREQRAALLAERNRAQELRTLAELQAKYGKSDN